MRTEASLTISYMKQFRDYSNTNGTFLYEGK